MPAIITHHVFGEDAGALLPDELLSSQEDLLAFLLGNQGTDPFWASFSSMPNTARACHLFATCHHKTRTAQALLALRRSVSHLSDADKTVGRAFALGMLAHYLLDSMCHPLIYAVQNALIEADPELASGSQEVHAIIEADIDDWILWQKRQQTVLEAPCTGALMTTERISKVAGTLLAQISWEVFGIEIPSTAYGRSVADYRLFYRLIDPPASRMPALAERVEELFRPHSRLRAQAHHATRDDDCRLANLEHHLWLDPVTRERSVASIADLFHDALIAWPTFARRYVEGDDRRLEAMIADINYYGEPTGPGVL